LPPATLEACADHCNIVSSRLDADVDQAYQLMESLKEPDINIDLEQIMDQVLSEGIELFVQPFQSLLSTLEEKMQQLSPAQATI
jgi:transaldolase